MERIIGLKELRARVTDVEEQVRQGLSFLVVKRSRPIFKIVPPLGDEQWEEVIDFTKIRRGGVDINELLKRL